MIIGTPTKIAEQLKDLKQDKKYKLVEWRETRSNLQNRYLHACFKFLWDELGYEASEMKEMIKYKFLKVETEHWDYVRETRWLDTKELTDFINNLRKWGAEIGFFVPSPNDDRIDQFYEQYL